MRNQKAPQSETSQQHIEYARIGRTATLRE